MKKNQSQMKLMVILKKRKKTEKNDYFSRIRGIGIERLKYAPFRKKCMKCLKIYEYNLNVMLLFKAVLYYSCLICVN